MTNGAKEPPKRKREKKRKKNREKKTRKREVKIKNYYNCSIMKNKFFINLLQ